MSSITKYIFLFLFAIYVSATAQNRIKIDAVLNAEAKIITIEQEIIYENKTGDTLRSLVLNDWTNSYSDKDTPLARRFSDEYVRAYHLAKDYERGSTRIISLKRADATPLNWKRPENHPDIIEIKLTTPIYPGETFTINAEYEVKVPKDMFTRFGYDDNGNFVLKNWFLSPARYSDGGFALYSNENVDDIANATADYTVAFTLPMALSLTSDLTSEILPNTNNKTYLLRGKNRTDFTILLEVKNSFEAYRIGRLELSTNLKANRTNDIERSILINNIVNFTKDNLGEYPLGKIVVSQTDYDRNPVYGLNQLPAFLSPFPDSFMYEIKFLKTYMNAYLKTTLKLDPRKDNWLYDGIQMQLMMKYIEENHPDKKMMGQLGNWRIFRGFNLFNVTFNEQYNYLYLLMARKNLDQPVGDPKNKLLKFNEQIAGKYRSGLNFKYLDNYLGGNAVSESIKEFYTLNAQRQTSREDYRNIITSKTDKDINWFFDTTVATRHLIDFKLGAVKKDNDSLKVKIINRTGTNVPVPVYGIKDNNTVFKKWLVNVTTDTIVNFPANIDKLSINYNGEMPEFNERNNTRLLRRPFFNNKPYKFTFFQDLENPRYNQIFFVPSFTFNIYDGVSVGMRFHNKSLLEKPFIFDIEPTYSSNTKELIGSFSLVHNNYIREGSLYSIRYSLSGSTFHYADDAAYLKFTPSIQFRFRDEDLRENKRQNILLRQVLVNRERSAFVATQQQNENYSVFNVRYSKYESEITRHYNFLTDVQLANNFGKLSGEVQFRRLFNDNRQINLRLYTGMFMYRDTNSEFFSFGLDRPTDYMFDYNLYGRSETTGLFSQQYVMGEGGFKSKLDTRYANQFMTTLNGSFNIWNWIEVYGDAGIFKNKFRDTKFVYDSGIRLNLVPDYFELYFPVQSSNGFELDDAHYAEKIRFVITISPNTLINLATRKWF